MHRILSTCDIAQVFILLFSVTSLLPCTFACVCSACVCACVLRSTCKMSNILAAIKMCKYCYCTIEYNISTYSFLFVNFQPDFVEKAVICIFIACLFAKVNVYCTRTALMLLVFKSDTLLLLLLGKYCYIFIIVCHHISSLTTSCFYIYAFA